MTTIHLIRHGQASFGEENYDKLSARGELQSKVLGQYLKQILAEAPYVISGTMQRHQDTAAISLAECFPELDLEQDANWNEFDHQQVFARYDANLTTAADIKQALVKAKDPNRYLTEVFYAAMQRWSDPSYAHDYDESWATFNQRTQTALSDLLQHIEIHQPKYAVVYSSGGVISSLIGHLLELKLLKTFELNWAISNCSISTVQLTSHSLSSTQSHQADDSTASQSKYLKLLSLNEHHYLKAKDAQLATWM